MKLGAVQYSLTDRAFDIFLAGCAAPHCPGCHNPEMQDFTVGRDLNNWDLVDDISAAESMIDRIRIMGGEPFDQPFQDLIGLVGLIYLVHPLKDLWIFTKYHYEELSRDQKRVLKYVDYVKHGRYVAEMPSYICDNTGLTLASSNQYVQRYLRKRSGKPVGYFDVD